MVRIGVEAEPTNVRSVAEILRGTAEAGTYLYHASRYVRPELLADIIFPVGRFRENFEFCPHVGKLHKSTRRHSSWIIPIALPERRDDLVATKTG